MKVKLGLFFLVVTMSLSCFSQDSLRYWAEKLENKNIGTALDDYFFDNSFWLATGKKYNKIVIGQFNGIVAGNDMKMGYIHPAIDKYDFRAGDILVDFAEEHGMIARGHTLVWHAQNPGWFNDGEFTRDSLLGILKDHITTIVTHFKGRIKEWDVVNEVFNGDGTLRQSKWYTVIGEDYIDSAFVWAHQADPDALLVMNDYGAESYNDKSGGMARKVQKMIAAGIPIDAIGMQAHFSAGGINYFSLKQNMKRFEEMGLKMLFTEVDIKIAKDEFWDDGAFATQALDYGTLLSIFLNDDYCPTFMVWGFSDADSWIPANTDNAYGQACIYDAYYRTKPAYYAMLDTLKAHNGVVGILPQSKVQELTVFPNPAKTTFSINCSYENLFNEIKIYDVTGKLVTSRNSLVSGQEMDVTFLKNGIYYIRSIGVSGNVYTAKLIKQ